MNMILAFSRVAFGLASPNRGSLVLSEANGSGGLSVYNLPYADGTSASVNYGSDPYSGCVLICRGYEATAASSSATSGTATFFAVPAITSSAKRRLITRHVFHDANTNATLSGTPYDETTSYGDDGHRNTVFVTENDGAAVSSGTVTLAGGPHDYIVITSVFEEE